MRARGGALRSTAGRQSGGGDSGSSGVVALAVVGIFAVLAFAIVGVGAALAGRQRIIAAADAGALAAADTALGIHPGVPCEQAARVVAAHDAVLSGCHAEGAVVTVEVSGAVAGIAVTARARAGPPP